jgi:hypothetical protein
MSKNVTVQQNIPKSFTPSVDRPFEPIGVRDLNTPGYDRNNQRLTDQQVKDMITNPAPPKDPNERLNTLSAADNKKNQAEFESEKIYNLSLSQLATRTTTTVHDVLDDLVNFNPQDGVRGMLQIFTQSDRLMYIGIIVVIFTILMLLFKSKDD